MKIDLMKIIIYIAITAAAAGIYAADPVHDGRDQPLTDAQKSTVSEILSRYNPHSLSEKDIESIREAFREEHLGGRALDEAVESAGFSAKQFRPSNGDRKQNKKTAGSEFTIEQATSDNAQLKTIAFDGMSWITGSFYCDTFLPPGKISDFFGFQYLRDNDSSVMGHNTDFLTRIANNMTALLSADQKQKLIALGKEQAPLIAEYAVRRYPLMRAFRRYLENDLPAGKKGIDHSAVMKFSADLYELDSKLFIKRAQVMAEVLGSFTPDQNKKIQLLAKQNWKAWPDVPESDDKKNIPHDVHVALMTYVSEMFSWYAGSVDADTYFCPEGNAKYFGAFYVKDAPAVRTPNYSIGLELTGDGGDNFLRTLDDTQRPLIQNLVSQQKPYLSDIVRTRRAVSSELRKLLSGKSIDVKLVTVLSRKYGELDGKISCLYAEGFTAVARSLSSSQKDKLQKIRNLDAKYTPQKPFLYADPYDLPEAISTEGFFK